MSILKAEILTHLNKELNRTETDIDEHILEALKDLSLQDEFLWVETNVDTIQSRPYYSLPLDYKSLLSIKIDDENSMEKIDWGEYQMLIANETSADRSMPDRFCIHGGFFYAYPTPDAVYTCTLFYNNFILESEDGINAVDDIKFRDIFRNAIYAKTKMFYCKSKGLKQTAIDYETDYRQLILPQLKNLVQKQVRQVQYNDW